MKIKPVTFKLVLMLFLEFAVWGAYLTSLGRYLGNIGLGSQIKWFFAMQGIVSIFMPTLMGIVADKKRKPSGSCPCATASPASSWPGPASTA